MKRWHEVDADKQRDIIGHLNATAEFDRWEDDNEESACVYEAAAALLEQCASGPVVPVARVRKVLGKYHNSFIPPYATVLILQDLDIPLDAERGEGGE